MPLMTNNELRTYTLDVMYGQILEIDPSFIIVYDCKSGNTWLVNAENEAFIAESLSGAIIKTWKHYFEGDNEYGG